MPADEGRSWRPRPPPTATRRPTRCRWATPRWARSSRPPMRCAVADSNRGLESGNAMAGGRQCLRCGGRHFRRADIGIEGKRIAAIMPQAKPNRKDDRLRSAGAWLLPGLIDCHVHLTIPTELADPGAGAKRSDAAVALYAAKAAERTLHGGITTARDVGGWNYVEMAVRDAINQGLASARACSSPAGCYPSPRRRRLLSRHVRSRQRRRGSASKAARKQLAMGADLIKVMATGAMLSSENEDARAIQYQAGGTAGGGRDRARQLQACRRPRPCLPRHRELPSRPAATASSTAPSPTRPC